MGAFVRQYGVLLTDTTAIYLNHPKYATPADFAVAADWTPAAGDIKVSKDGGAAANITNLPTFVTNKGWKYILTAAEIQSQQTIVRIVDSATKAIVDDQFIIETMGHASSMWPDPDSANPVVADVVKIGGSAAVVDNVVDDYDGTGYAKPLSTTGLVDNAITAAKIASDAITAAKVAADLSAEIADTVWDELLADHRVAGSFGLANQFFAGTAAAGGQASITLANDVPAVADLLAGWLVVIVSGPGIGEKKRILSMTSGRVATVDSNWIEQPGPTSSYVAFRN